ncbi:MAG TPA: trypsin-like peptidase domain-containing protein, partial [Candidatus Limnocylindrales bacterium]
EAGSGVIIERGGKAYALTNRHVIKNSGLKNIKIQLADGRVLHPTKVWEDSGTDVAVMQIEGGELVPARIGNSDALEIGDLVLAIGSPFGLSHSVTSGIISAKGRRDLQLGDDGLRYQDFLQTDAAINPGNSGGPLLDAAGNVIGVNTAVARDSNGIGFAIPVNIARPIMQQALAGQDLARPYIGIHYVPINAEVAKEENLPVKSGALINTADGTVQAAVEPGSPAADAGLREGDIVTAIEGQAVDDEHPLNALLTQYAPGQSVDLQILRNGNTETVAVTLGTRPANLSQ